MNGLNTYSLSAVLETPTGTPATSGMFARDVKVFRVGSFKNSRGVRNTWTGEMLQTAVENFRELRDRNIFPHVPVRMDHTQSVKDVVGYFADMRFDGTFLIADIEFTSPSAYNDYQKGHLRNRSLEIGEYETNGDEKYHPVVSGLAFVDIAAVEGLHRQPENGEHNMSGTQTAPAATTEPVTTPPVEPPAAATPPPAAATPPPAAEPPATPAAVGSQQPPASTPTLQEATPAGGDHGRVNTQTFRCNGVETTDAATVQAHITSLETFRQSAITDIRSGFVDDLVQRRVITAPQAEQFRALVQTFSMEQFAAFRTSYEGAAPANLFARHNLDGDGTNTPPDAAALRADEISLHTESIEQFRRMGKDDEFIQGTASYKALQVLQAQK